MLLLSLLSKRTYDHQPRDNATQHKLGLPHQPLRKCPRAGFYEVIFSTESLLCLDNSSLSKGDINLAMTLFEIFVLYEGHFIKCLITTLSFHYHYLNHTSSPLSICCILLILFLMTGCVLMIHIP